MDPNEVLLAIEEQLLKRRLTPAERIVLGQTWNKQTYEQMAKHSGYGDAHLKDTGYKLWRDLSQALGQRVTKKSLLFVLQEHLQSSTTRSLQQVETVLKRPPDPINPPTPLQFPSDPLPPHSPLYKT